MCYWFYAQHIHLYDRFAAQIKFLKFKDESGKVSEVKGNYGQTWESLNVKNDVLNSIFKAVDSNHNSDGKIQAEDLNMLNKISLYNYTFFDI